MDKFKGMILGALAGTAAATAFALLGSRQSLIGNIRDHAQDWAEKARNVKENVYDDMSGLIESRRTRRRKVFTTGALLGLLIGAGSAALLTPKTGRQLRKDLSHKYRGVANKTHTVVDFINQNGYRRPIKAFSKVLKSKSLSKKKHPTRTRARVRVSLVKKT